MIEVGSSLLENMKVFESRLLVCLGLFLSCLTTIRGPIDN